MTDRISAWLTATLVTSLSITATRLRAAPQRGQGTVEYVALILLVAGVLAVGVAAASKTKFNLETTVTEQLKQAIESVSGGK